MKKLILTLASLALAPAAFAQVEIGLKISPSITSLRAESPAPESFQGTDSKVSFGGGVFVDYFFGQNYAINTGLFLTGKGGSFTYTDTGKGGMASSYKQPMSQKLTMQYLEIPATIKLFTNEVAPATRLYFQVGPSIAIPVGTRINGEKFYTDTFTQAQSSASSHVFAVDVNLLGSVGAEYQLGSSTKLLAGLSYHRGLLDLDRYFEKERGFKDVSIKNSVFALDLGIKF